MVKLRHKEIWLKEDVLHDGLGQPRDWQSLHVRHLVFHLWLPLAALLVENDVRGLTERGSVLVCVMGHGLFGLRYVLRIGLPVQMIIKWLIKSIKSISVSRSNKALE